MRYILQKLYLLYHVMILGYKHIITLTSLLIFASYIEPACVYGLTIKEISGDKGLSGWSVKEDTEIIRVMLSFVGGTSLESESEYGLTALYAKLLSSSTHVPDGIRQGKTELNSTILARALMKLGIEITYSADVDALYVYAVILNDPETRTMALNLIANILNAPHFSKDSIKHAKQQLISDIKIENNIPQLLAIQNWFTNIFPNHHYGRPINSTSEHIQKLSKNRANKLWKRFANRDSLRVSIISSLPDEEIKQWLDVLYDSLEDQGTELAPSKFNTNPVIYPATSINVVNFDTPHSYIVVGHSALHRNDSRYFASYIMNYILGSPYYPQSYLQQSLRDENKLAYFASSNILTRKNTAVILGATSTSTENAKQAIEIIKSEWVRMITRNISDEEVQTAIHHAINSLLLSLRSGEEKIWTLSTMQVQDLDMTYFIDRNAKISAVTKQMVRSVARDILQINNLSITLLGRHEQEDFTE